MTDASMLKTDGDVDVLELRQALWDAYGTLGFDQDGDQTPAAVRDLPNVVRRAAAESVRDYEDLAAEAESQAERLEVLEEIRRWAADGWRAVADPLTDGSVRHKWRHPDHPMQEMSGELAAVLWPDPE
jgi:hypothetical protein